MFSVLPVLFMLTLKWQRNTVRELVSYIIPYSRRLAREKTFTNFVILEPPTKGFSMKFGRVVPTYMYDRS